MGFALAGDPVLADPDDRDDVRPRGGGHPSLREQHTPN